MAQWTNLQWIERFLNLTLLYIACGKSRGLHLAEAGLMAGRLIDTKICLQYIAWHASKKVTSCYAITIAMIFCKKLCDCSMMLLQYCYVHTYVCLKINENIKGGAYKIAK